MSREPYFEGRCLGGPLDGERHTFQGEWRRVLVHQPLPFVRGYAATVDESAVVTSHLYRWDGHCWSYWPETPVNGDKLSR